jgi:hypothetical protein
MIFPRHKLRRRVAIFPRQIIYEAKVLAGLRATAEHPADDCVIFHCIFSRERERATPPRPILCVTQNPAALRFL